MTRLSKFLLFLLLIFNSCSLLEKNEKFDDPDREFESFEEFEDYMIKQIEEATGREVSDGNEPVRSTPPPKVKHKRIQKVSRIVNVYQYQEDSSNKRLALIEEYNDKNQIISRDYIGYNNTPTRFSFNRKTIYEYNDTSLVLEKTFYNKEYLFGHDRDKDFVVYDYSGKRRKNLNYYNHERILKKKYSGSGVILEWYYKTLRIWKRSYEKEYVFDSVGRIDTIQGCRANNIKFVYDSIGRIAKKLHFGQYSSTIEMEEKYTYFKNSTQVLTTYLDENGNPLNLLDTLDYYYEPQLIINYFYDSNRNLLKKTKGYKGQDPYEWKNFEYDTFGRLIKMEWFGMYTNPKLISEYEYIELEKPKRRKPYWKYQKILDLNFPIQNCKTRLQLMHYRLFKKKERKH